MARKLTLAAAPWRTPPPNSSWRPAGRACPSPFAGSVDTDITGLAAVTALGVLGTGVTFYLNYRLIADEGPVTAATVGYLLPVVSVTLARYCWTNGGSDRRAHRYGGRAGGRGPDAPRKGAGNCATSPHLARSQATNPSTPRRTAPPPQPGPAG